MRNGDYELIIAPEGYPGKRYRGRYAYEHRVNWWRQTGLNPDGADIIIHHRDEAKRNNDGKNLEAMTRAKHTVHHTPKAVAIKYTCEHCKREFERRKNGKKARFCSRRCIGFAHGSGR